MISATSNRCRDVNSYAALACSISVEIVDVWDICDVDEESSLIICIVLDLYLYLGCG